VFINNFIINAIIKMINMYFAIYDLNVINKFDKLLSTMIKTIAFFFTVLFCYLIYTVYNRDLRITETKQEEIKIVIYTKSDCRFCEYAKKLLHKKNLPYNEIDLTWDHEIHDNLKSSTNQNTIPYIYINQHFIGGYQDLLQLSDAELKKIME
jgi:glutaredoxin 3